MKVDQTAPALAGGFSILSAIFSRSNRNRRGQATAVDAEPWHEIRGEEYFCKKDDRPLKARTRIALNASSEATCYYCESCGRGVILESPQRVLPFPDLFEKAEDAVDKRVYVATRP